jgi:hypothetical protein
VVHLGEPARAGVGGAELERLVDARHAFPREALHQEEERKQQQDARRPGDDRDREGEPDGGEAEVDQVGVREVAEDLAVADAVDEAIADDRARRVECELGEQRRQVQAHAGKARRAFPRDGEHQGRPHRTPAAGEENRRPFRPLAPAQVVG